MKKEYFRYMGLIFLIMGLIGIISETGPVWARYILLSSGILILLFTFLKRSGWVRRNPSLIVAIRLGSFLRFALDDKSHNRYLCNPIINF